MKKLLIAASLLTSVSSKPFLKHRQGDPQTSLILDSTVIGSNLAQDGIDNSAAPGQIPSLTSVNNFINFCIGKTITNGQQVNDGTSCNPVPAGDIPSHDIMPSCKFKNPQNFAVVKSNTEFDLVVNVNNFEAGLFANSAHNYLSAPQQLSSQRGTIQGYIRFVVQEVNTFQDTTPLDPNIFTFFRSANGIAVDDAVRTTIATGLPNGTYRIAAMITATNHQPVVLPVDQHGAAHDMIYISITDDGPVPAPLPTHTVTISATGPSPASTASTGKGSTVGTSSPSLHKSSSVGPAVGGTLGALAAVGLATMLTIFLLKRRRARNAGSLVFPYAPASSNVTLEQFTLEPLPPSQSSQDGSNRINGFSNPTPPRIPSKDQSSVVARAREGVTSSGSATSSSYTPPPASPRTGRTPTTRSTRYWDAQSTAPSEAPPPYIEQPD